MSTNAILIEASRFYEKGEYEEARSLYEDVLLSNPYHPVANRNYANTLSQLGEYERAFEYHEKALEFYKNDAKYYSDRGVLLQRLGRYEESEYAHREAERLAPNDPGILNNLGLCLIARNRLDEAIRILRKGLEYGPNNIDLMQSLADALGNSYLDEDALGWIERAISIIPNNPDLVDKKLVLLTKLKRWEVAEELIREIDLREKSSTTLRYLSLFYKEKEDYATALRYIDEALGLDNTKQPTSQHIAFLYFTRGAILFDMGRNEKALESFQAAQEADPESVFQPHFYEMAVASASHILEERERLSTYEESYQEISKRIIVEAQLVDDELFSDLLTRRLELEFVRHIAIAENLAAPQQDKLNKFRDIVDIIIGESPIKLVPGGSTLLQLSLDRVEDNYEQQRRNRSEQFSNLVSKTTADLLEQVIEVVNKLVKTVVLRYQDFISSLTVEAIGLFIECCVERMFEPRTVRPHANHNNVEHYFLFAMVNGKSSKRITTKTNMNWRADQIFKCGMEVRKQRYVHPRNVRNPVGYFAPGTYEQIQLLEYIES